MIFVLFSCSVDAASDGDDCTATPKRPRHEEREYKPEWRSAWLMDFDEASKEMVCMLCYQRLKCLRVNTIKKLHDRRHGGLKTTDYSDSKKKLCIMRYETETKRQTAQMQKFTDPRQNIALAPYKLAFVIGKHNKPLSDCDHFLEFAQSADPESEVFKCMSCSRANVTRTMIEIHDYLQQEIKEDINQALFWSYMLDEATDKSVLEEVIIYARFIDITEGKIMTRFLAVKGITGHPDASNIFSAVKHVLAENGINLPTSQLVCQTSDGASTLLSIKNGVAAKAKNAFNQKLFVQHCFNHRLVLVSKDTQHNIPEHVEDTIKAVLNHFKYSAVSQSQLKKIMELKDEKYVKLVTYHKVRWLSLSDCVARIVSLHSTLSQYFENEAVDRANRKAVQRKCKELYERLSDPTLVLYLFFLHAYLPVLSDVNVQCQRRNGLIF